MLKKIAIAVALIVVVLVAVVATRPPSYRVVRTTAVNAPAEVAYAQVADFHRWEGWSPWAKLDATMKTSFSGPASGPGEAYAWTGNDKVGEGRMTVLRAKPGEEIAIKLEFLKPFESTSETTFSFVPQGGATAVTWAMEGQNNFMAKAASLFMDMDKMIGSDFDRGLANLKAVSEAEAQKAAPPAAAAAAPPAAAAPAAIPAVGR